MDELRNSNFFMVLGLSIITLFGLWMVFGERSEQTGRPDYARCLSRDGSNRAFVDGLKERLREPRSFEHISTVVGPDVGLGSRPISMTYRARNGFGGMSVEEAQAILQTGNCQVTNIRS